MCLRALSVVVVVPLLLSVLVLVVVVSVLALSPPLSLCAGVFACVCERVSE